MRIVYRVLYCCILAAILALLIASFPVPPNKGFSHQICEYNNATKHEDCATYSIALFILVKIGETLNQYGAAITALATVAVGAFTWQLKRSTDRLWNSGERQLAHLRESSERELRAYISIRPGTLTRISPNTIFHFTAINTNDGKTPAYSAQQAGVMQIQDHPLPDDFQFPELPIVRRSKTMIPPNVPFNASALATELFTKEEIIEILEGRTNGQRLYIYGQVDYVDAFKKPHWTRFCYSFPGWHEAVPLARADRWDEITKKLFQPGFALQFELAAQHNVTDDG